MLAVMPVKSGLRSYGGLQKSHKKVRVADFCHFSTKLANNRLFFADM